MTVPKAVPGVPGPAAQPGAITRHGNRSWKLSAVEMLRDEAPWSCPVGLERLRPSRRRATPVTPDRQQRLRPPAWGFARDVAATAPRSLTRTRPLSSSFGALGPLG